MKRFLIAVGLFLFVPVSTEAADASDTTIVFAFVECAGLYYASKDLGPEYGVSADEILLANELGNGAAIAARWLLAQIRTLSQPLEPNAPIPPEVWNRSWKEAGDYVDDQIASSRAHWRARLRGSGNPLVAEQLGLCARISPIQAQIIDEMRQNALTAPWPDSQ